MFKTIIHQESVNLIKRL